MTLQIQGTTTEEELQTVLNTPHILDAVMACGYTKFIASTTLSDKEEIVKLLCMREVILGSKSAIDQFVEGLDKVGWKCYLGYVSILVLFILPVKGGPND